MATVKEAGCFNPVKVGGRHFHTGLEKAKKVLNIQFSDVAGESVRVALKVVGEDPCGCPGWVLHFAGNDGFRFMDQRTRGGAVGPGHGGVSEGGDV